MITIKELTNNYGGFTVSRIVFKSQTDVYFDMSVIGRKCRFSKADLIGCINYYLGRLSILTDINKVKHGFVLENFKYYELSVYLHGLLQLYCSLVGFAPVGELPMKRFSHLPHDVLKPEKIKKNIEVTLLNDFYDGRRYVCVIKGIPVCQDTLLMLKAHIFLHFPSLRDYYFTFIVK